MASAPQDEAVLSDFEEEDLEAAPEVLSGPTPLAVSESLKAALGELEAERQARKAAELAKAEVESKFERLKTLTQEVAKQRDEAFRHKDEALHVKEELGKQLEEALQIKTDAAKQKEEMQRQRDDNIKARESARSEIEATARLLITNAEKITASVSGIKSFSGGLPRTNRYTGLAAIAYGFTKRMEEVVDEVVRQRDAALKRRDEMQEQIEEVTRQRDAAIKGRDQMHEQLEQRSYSAAIEVSQLEASVGDLTGQVERKDVEIERWRALVAVKEDRVKELETDILEKSGKLIESSSRVEKTETHLQSLKVEVERQSELNSRQAAVVGAVRKGLLEIVRAMDPNTKPLSPQPVADGGDIESLAEDIVELVTKVGTSWKTKDELLQKLKQDAEDSRQSLVEEKYEASEKLKLVLKEKENVLKALSELRMTLMQRQLLTEELESPNDQVKDGAWSVSSDQGERNNDLQVIALESEVKELRQEKLNLESMLGKTRAEIQELKTVVTDRAAQIHQLERQGGDLQNQVRGLREDIIAAEDEVVRWKGAAKEEAASGAALAEEEKRLAAEVAALNQQLSHLKAMLAESSSKLRSKEEMSVAAIHARNTAERALLLADERAAELRERIAEMTRQLEEADRKADKSSGLGSRITGCLNMCWPWLRGRGRPDRFAEMEQLMEPLV